MGSWFCNRRLRLRERAVMSCWFQKSTENCRKTEKMPTKCYSQEHRFRQRCVGLGQAQVACVTGLHLKKYANGRKL